METEPFEEFLKNKKKDEQKFDWNERKTKWVNAVNAFYKNVNNWLSPFIKQSLLQINEKEISIDEEYIGQYNLTQLNILIGNDIISLIPRGILILGSYGRIDMRGPKGERLIIEQNWNDWKFATKVNRRQLWETNEKSFQAAIQDLING